jgi:hypothetical protein
MNNEKGFLFNNARLPVDCLFRVGFASDSRRAPGKGEMPGLRYVRGQVP